MTRHRAVLLFAFAVPLLAPATARAFCRTTTCEPPAEFSPTAAACEPSGWASTCQSAGKRDVPLWWATRCVSWDVQQNASRRVTLSEAQTAMTEAFAAWSGATCPGGGSPSIAAQDLGPVACDQVGYEENAANQHVLVFRDDSWPYQTAAEMQSGQKSLTIALTTVNFDKNTGEIFDADIEINSGQHNVVPTDNPGTDTFDLRAVLTHETGHFLGLAHSPDTGAVMFAQDEGADTKKRVLAQDDVNAICAVYPANGTRVVSTVVSASGTVAAGSCDPTPRHGFSSACAVPQASSGCSAAPGDGPGSGGAFFAFFAIALGALARRPRGPKP